MGIELPSLHDKTIPEPIVPLLYQSTKGLAFQTLGLIFKDHWKSTVYICKGGGL